jgi:hypothetical protein
MWLDPRDDMWFHKAFDTNVVKDELNFREASDEHIKLFSECVLSGGVLKIKTKLVPWFKKYIDSGNTWWYCALYLQDPEIYEGDYSGYIFPTIATSQPHHITIGHIRDDYWEDQVWKTFTQKFKKTWDLELYLDGCGSQLTLRPTADGRLLERLMNQFNTHFWGKTEIYPHLVAQKGPARSSRRRIRKKKRT